MRPLLIALIAATTLLMGCAFTTANLDIEHTEAEAHKGPMSRVEPTAFWIEPLEDQRKDKARIGYKRNGFGMETADVISKRPVPDIVRDALINTIRANDHTLSESEPQLLVRGEVTEFWYDLDVNFWTVEFMGSVSTHLKFINPQVDEVIYERAYDGNYNEKSAGGYHGTMERVMNLALDRMIEQIRTDPSLLAALRSMDIDTESSGFEETAQSEEMAPASTP